MLTNQQVNKLISRVKEGTAIYITKNVPSQKNSKDIFRKRTKEKIYCKKCGAFQEHKTIPFITSSKLVKEYKKEKEVDYLKAKVLFKKLTKGVSPPYIIGYYIIRSSKRKFDYTNIAEAPQDIFTKLGFWEDDNMDNNIPIFLGYNVSKKLAGIIIVILNGKVTIDI